MSYDVLADYRQFRQIVREYAEHMLRHFPQTAHRHWLVQCYCSEAAFEARFPAEQQRAEILEELQRNRDAVDDAAQYCGPIFDAFPIESPPQQPTVGN
jgi:hypothetical protein